MKATSTYSLLCIGLLLSIVACNKIQTQNPLSSFLSVDPPFENLAIGCNADVIDNTKGGEILYESGSKLVIPENAFVDKDGNPVKGDVKVNYREFHSSAEIMTSGIPMTYSKDGKVENFESAGMFELTAEHNGEEVQIAEGKEITCHTITHKKDNDFDFFYYDKEEGNWADLQIENKEVEPATTPEPSDMEGGVDTAAFTRPMKPQKADMKLPVFEIGEESKSDTKKARSIGRISNSKLWQFAPGYKLEKKSMEKVLSGTDWKDHSLEKVEGKENVYRLYLGKEKEDPIYVTPVLFGKDYRKAMAQYKEELQEFNKKAKEVNDVKAFEEKRQNFWRTARIARTGIYNWDRLMKRNDVVKLDASFALESGAALPAATQVFMLTGKNKDIITFYPSQFGNFAFDPKVENTLMAILPGDKVGIFKKESFGLLNMDKLKRNKKHKFVLQSVAANIGGVKQLQTFINSL